MDNLKRHIWIYRYCEKKDSFFKYDFNVCLIMYFAEVSQGSEAVFSEFMSI
uniref:Uncharacterized protein n=1 Tax=Anguilla anguilla TaxID=7936 RepID=A0A0E9W953_ANGAN